jgi:hypothetical protein
MSTTGRRTFPWDLARSAMDGCVEPMFRTFALVVAIQFFHCSVIEKSVIASSLAVGHILSLVYSSMSGLWFRRRSIQTFVPYVGIAGGALLGAMAPSGLLFALGILLVGACYSLRFPSLIAIYRENYRGIVRGQILGLATLTLTILSLVVNYTGGMWLDAHIKNFRILFVLVAAAAALGAFSALNIPCGIITTRRVDPPSAYIRVLKQHSVFGFVLASWFIFGIANLAMIPQQFEFLSGEQYGFNLSPGAIALLIGVVPLITQVFCTQLWARLFDRFSFITVRILMNAFWIAYMVFFFNTSSLSVVALASCCQGVGLAGGSIAWNLWVTKFADPEDTAKYMAIHTFLTGVRGLIGPYIAYVYVRGFSIQSASWIGAFLMLVSTVMLVPLRGQSTRRKNGSASTQTQ